MQTSAGLVYSTVQGQARVGNLLLTCGYGQILSVAAESGNPIVQGEKLYMDGRQRRATSS